MAKPRIDKNITLPEDVLRKLLTPSEVRMLKNRWLIVQYLKDGLSIRTIAAKIKVGTDTVVRVSRMLEKNSSLKVNKTVSTRTPWVFGKSED